MGKNMLSFVGNHQAIPFPFSPSMSETSYCSTSLPAFTVFNSLVALGHFNRCEMVLIIVLALYAFTMLPELSDLLLLNRN